MSSNAKAIAVNEVTEAALHRACSLLIALEIVITREAKQMPPRDQDTLRDARAFLVEMGKRAPECLPTWEDRTCTCLALADGTNRTKHCPLHPLPTP